MKLHAIVPVKALERAKSRLAATLAPAERRLLVLEMLGKVLLALDRSPAATVWVVSADPAVLAFARARGAMPLLEHNGELNEALAQARATARAAGAEAIVVVPADVPLIAPADIAALAALLGAAHVAIAPDAAGKGTNALALRLDPQLPELPFAFGADSAERHLQSAAERGLIARSYRSPTLALDVDDAASLASYRARLAEPACTAVG
jgi:2-phospho-L-lactate/phosphoenolpyruvate guanylyltransferase